MPDETHPTANTADSAHVGTGADSDPRVGTVIDKYSVVRVLGRGGMGAVYEVRHTLLARRFAMKFLLPQFAQEPDLLRRFENEARAAGSLEHSNVAAVTDFGRAADGSPYLVMEYLEGEDCAKLLQKYGALPLPRAANLLLQACRGLSVAHAAGIVHRDIKPENLFIARAGDGSDWVKVLDFGIAKLRQVDATVATRTGVAMGTALYMSPEQARGAASVDERTDVWSLGVVLYQLLSGRRPFEGGQFLEVIYQILSVDPKPLSELRPDLPRGLYEVVARAMDKDLSRRLPSVNALAQLLEPFAVGGVYAALQLADSGNARTVSASETYPSASTSTGGVALARSGPFAFHGASGLPPSLGSGAPLSPSAQEVTHVRAGRWRRVLVGATLAGLTGGAVWWYTQQPAVSALVPVAAGSAMAHTAGAEAEFTAHPSLVAASPVEASAARRGSPSLSATEPSPALATPGQSLPRVRSASEHGERRPNVPEPVRAEVHTPNLVSAGAVVGVAPPAAAPPAQRDSEPHPARGTQNSKIQIEEGNPYEH